jgi:predicted metal-dependent hydrolase
MSAQLSLFAPEDRSDPWLVRVSQRARRLSVRVYPGGKVEIVVPPRVPPGMVQRFIGQHREWIDRRVLEWRATAAPVPVRPDHLHLKALGRHYRIEYRAAAGVTRVRPRADVAPDLLEVSGAVDNLRRVAAALERWLRRQVTHAMESALRQLAVQGGFSFSRLRIRRQRTRWGSCSSRGTLSLNVCLAFLEPAVVRYLLVHELCHTRHMNHSKRFWALVEQHEPDYRQLNRQLNGGWRQVPAWILL